MNEKQKLELNWPDNVSHDTTDWEPTTIQNKLIVFVSIHYDQDVPNPCEDQDGFGMIRSLSTKHINNISRDEIDELLIENHEHIIPLSYFEHGNCKWGTMGSMELMPDFNWDGVSFAGLWIGDKECINTVDYWEKEAKEKDEPFNRKEKFVEMAEQACETYSAWSNGECYGYQIELYRLQFNEDDLEPIEEHGDYYDLDCLREDSCWGFIGNDIDYMKEQINNNFDAWLTNIKNHSYFDDEGEPDFKQIVHEEFNRILLSIIRKQSAEELIQISGLYEVVSEHFNNEVLEEWEKEQLK